MNVPDRLAQLLREARHIVIFTGAGVSAESGILTFRDALTGLWERFDPEELATADAFRRNPDLVWGWYEWRRMRVMRAMPNAAHKVITTLERTVETLTLVTQNVDDLHERAGSSAPIHLHGSLFAPRCFACARPAKVSFSVPDASEDGCPLSPPKCEHCGGRVRPGVVWFGEMLPERALKQAFDAARSCDVLLSIGTSSVVYPAADIPREARRHGATVVEVNPNRTSLDDVAHFHLRGPAAQVMPTLVAAITPASVADR